MKKAFLLINEKHERITIRRRKTIRKLLCSNCRKRVEWLSFDEAVAISGETCEEINQLIENNSLDYYTAKNGELLICLESLMTLFLRKNI